MPDGSISYHGLSELPLFGADFLKWDALETQLVSGGVLPQLEIHFGWICKQWILVHQVVADFDDLLFGVPSDVEPLSHANIADDAVALGRDSRVAGVVPVELHQFRIARRVRRLMRLHLIQEGFHGLVYHVVPDRLRIEAPRIELHSRRALHEIGRAHV